MVHVEIQRNLSRRGDWTLATILTAVVMIMAIVAWQNNFATAEQATLFIAFIAISVALFIALVNPYFERNTATIVGHEHGHFHPICHPPQVIEEADDEDEDSPIICHKERRMPRLFRDTSKEPEEFDLDKMQKGIEGKLSYKKALARDRRFELESLRDESVRLEKQLEKIKKISKEC